MVLFRTTRSSLLCTLAWPQMLTSAHVISTVHLLAIVNARILDLLILMHAVPDERHEFDHVTWRFHPHNYFETGLNSHSIHITKWIKTKPVGNWFLSIHFQCERGQSGLNWFECTLIWFRCAVWTCLRRVCVGVFVWLKFERMLVSSTKAFINSAKMLSSPRGKSVRLHHNEGVHLLFEKWLTNPRK